MDDWPIIIKVQRTEDDKGVIERFTTPRIANQLIKYWKDRGWWVFVQKGSELLGRERDASS